MSTDTQPHTSASEGKNIEGAERGAGTRTETGDAKFTQADLDRIVKQRLDDHTRAVENRLAKEREEAERKAAEEKARANGELDKVIQAREARIKELEPLAERAETAEAKLHKVADARLAALPEKLRARVPAADAASAVARIEKIEELEEVLAELPTAQPPAGNGRGPKPAGAADPAKAAEGAKGFVASKRVYTL